MTREVVDVVRIRFTRQRPWLDRQAGVYRRYGEEIVVTEERARVIIGAGVAVLANVSAPAVDEPDAPDAPMADDLEAMTVAQLRTLAAERGVDVSQARRKADIIAALRGG